jgi:enoyl-CoA hydratase
MADSPVRLEREGPLCWLVLDRPTRGNALNDEVFDAIDSALHELSTDRAIKVLIIRGEGKGFCSGHDLGGQRRELNDVTSVIGHMKRSFDTFRRIWDFPKPVIASVHGYCVGAATQLCAACDVVVVSSDAEIGLPKLPMGAGLTPPMLALTIGVRRAKQMAFDIGSTMDGPTAVEWGWANMSVEPERLTEEVTALAMRMARAPLEVLSGQKSTLNRVAELQGFWSIATMGIEMDALHVFAKTATATGKAIQEYGVKGAVERFNQGLLEL